MPLELHSVSEVLDDWEYHPVNKAWASLTYTIIFNSKKGCTSSVHRPLLSVQIFMTTTETSVLIIVPFNKATRKKGTKYANNTNIKYLTPE